MQYVMSRPIAVLPFIKCNAKLYYFMDRQNTDIYNTHVQCNIIVVYTVFLYMITA